MAEEYGLMEDSALQGFERQRSQARQGQVASAVALSGISVPQMLFAPLLGLTNRL